jgi:hypothetical protein
MKSKEEIEYLAKCEANNDIKHANIKLGYQDGIYYGFNKGYTQCQEDMADMKYTEHDLHNLLRARRQLKSYTNKDVVTVFIDSLNKQD